MIHLLWHGRLVTRQLTTFLCIFLVTLVVLPGCESSDSSSTETAEKASSKKKAASPKSKKTKTTTNTSRSGSGKIVRTDADGRKWIEDIPYDVFFDNPLTVAKDDSPVSPGSNGASVAASGSDKSNGSSPSGTGTESEKGTDWQSIVSMEILEAEVKRIRNSMTGKLRVLGQYNSGYKDVQIDGATLAAVAGIIIEHPDPISWKEDAKYVRDLGVQVEANAQRLGKKSFEATKIPFEQFVSILSRSKPADLAEAREKVPFADQVDRNMLMRRFDKAFNALKSNVSNESALKDQAEMAIHESTILSALVRVIMTEGYDLTDDDEFMALLGQMFEASREMTKAVREEDFAKYELALSKVNNTCTQCHTSYRD